MPGRDPTELAGPAEAKLSAGTQAGAKDQDKGLGDESLWGGPAQTHPMRRNSLARGNWPSTMSAPLLSTNMRMRRKGGCCPGAPVLLEGLHVCVSMRGCVCVCSYACEGVPGVCLVWAGRHAWLLVGRGQLAAGKQGELVSTSSDGEMLATKRYRCGGGGRCSQLQAEGHTHT